MLFHSLEFKYKIQTKFYTQHHHSSQCFFRFMPYLMRLFEKQGGEILKQKVENLQELLKEVICI